jgi:hypothetical protein
LSEAADWDARLADLSSPGVAPLLHSWAWGEVQARAGWRVERLRLGGGMASVQLRGRPPFERAYVPRGPIPAAREVLEALVGWAKDRGFARLRVEPEVGRELAPLLRELGFRPAPQVQPQFTMIIPLEGGDEDVMASFNRGTRYNIRLAQKRGVEVEEGADAEELARQSAASAARQGINLPAASYYRLLLDSLPWSRTYVAKVEGEAVAAMLVIHHDRRGYYMFSGSNGRHRELKPVYAAKWAAIQAAIREGCRDYDLWGVPPGPDRNHPWYGLWEFKSGFNGRLVEYVGCWDLVLSELRHGVSEAGERARRRLGRLLRRGD